MKFGIRRKLLLLIASLSLALIVASVFISTRFYAASLESTQLDLCAETAASLSESIETQHVEFINDYKAKIEAVYREHREELEEASEREFESFDKREEFYDAITLGIFPPKHMLGLSQQMLDFKLEYELLRDEMDILSFAGGLDVSSVFFYDRANGNIVYLIDRMPEGSARYNFPSSVAKPWDKRLADALFSGTAVRFSTDSEFIALQTIPGAEDVYVLFAKQNTDMKQNAHLFMLYVFGILLGATLLIGLFSLLFADRLIVKNVKKLAFASERFTSDVHSGSPEKVPSGVRAKDEIGELSDKFELMQDSILRYISNLEEKTAREEKMKAELALAARIQQESLPKGGLKAGSASVESFIKPAREVGGDLFDYYMLGDHRIFFCIADVSGKGVPASLFMMRAKELIRTHVMTDDTLPALAQNLNNDLCAGNEENIFITAFFGVFDTETGKLSCLRAGHEKPMLRRGGTVTSVGEESNCVLGVYEDLAFSAEELTLLPGDTLFVFTDGLSEGINEQNEAFGCDRIAETLKNADGDAIGEEYRALLAFCGNAEQFDDVTMLTLSLSGRSPSRETKRMEIAAPTFRDITAVTDWAQSELAGFDRDRVAEIGLIVDEIMNNQISYAFEGVSDPILAVELLIDGDSARLVFEDNGVAFDPFSDVAEACVERSEGGYGLLLVSGLSEAQTYERIDGINRLTIVKNMRPDPV